MAARIAASAVVAVLLAAPPALAAAPPQAHNCAGVFASNFADGAVISGFAQQLHGVDELVLVDANCGTNRPV
jgi:hypothetical protein